MYYEYTIIYYQCSDYTGICSNTDYDDNVIEEFYETIEEYISKTPKKDFLIVQGDWNSIVGNGKHNKNKNKSNRSNILE